MVITNGSVQAAEQLYWYAAQTLAKAGYVVLTWDPQGQGQSDVLGEGPDANEGVPGAERRPPLLRRHRRCARLLPLHARRARSSRARAARPARATPPSRTAAWRRPQRGLQPVREAARTRERIGLAGHSYGAAGVSYVGQWDPRVKRDRRVGQPRRARAPAARPPRCAPCPADPSARTPDAPITKPALGMSADYGLIADAATPPIPTRWRRAEQSLAYIGRRRRHRRARDPRRHALRVQLHPEPGVRRRRCAAPTWPPGTRPRGSTSTSRATRAADARLLTTGWRDAERQPLLLLLPLAARRRRLHLRGPAHRLLRHGPGRRRVQLPVAGYLARRRNGMTVLTNAFSAGTADSGSMWSYVVWRSTSVTLARATGAPAHGRPSAPGRRRARSRSRRSAARGRGRAWRAPRAAAGPGWRRRRRPPGRRG